MYKKRFKKWGVRKRAYRKPHSTSVTPQIVPGSHIHRSKNPDVKHPPQSRYTEKNALDLVKPSIPKVYSDFELVLDSVFTWSQNKLDSYSAASDPMSKYLENPNQPPIQDSRTMYRTFELGFDLWSCGNGDLAGMAARKGFYVLEFVLTDDHPDLVWHILDTVYDMVDKGHLQLLKMFLQHASILGQRQLPGNHPLLRIIQILRECDCQTYEGRRFICHLLRQAWLRNVDNLSAHIGSMMSGHLWLYEQLIWDGRTRLRRHSGLATKREMMNQALKELARSKASPAKHDVDPDRLRVDALMLEFTQMDLGDKALAEKLASDLLKRTELDANTRSSARFHAYARKMLARIHESRQEWDKVEQNLKYAITMREAAHGTTTNLRVIRDMWVLAGYYKRVGKSDGAEQITQDAMVRAHQYLNDIPG